MATPAWAVDLWTAVKPYADKLAVWRGYEQELQTLAIYGIGIAIFTALVFAFYRSLSKRRPIPLPTSDMPGWVGGLSRIVERGLLFPLTSFLFFAVLAASLFFLTKPEVTTGTILTIAMAVVVGVRVTVYVSEEMSNDLAKLVPLSLLAVVLVDPGYLKLGDAWARFADSTRAAPLLFRYFLLFIALEAVFGTVRYLLLKAGSRAGIRRTKGIAKETLFSVNVQQAEAPNRPRVR